MKTTKRVKFLRHLFYALVVLAVVLCLGFGASPAFAASTAQGTSSKPFWKVASIIFIILDIIEIVVVVILAIYLRKLNKKRKLLSQLNVFVFPFLALGIGFGIGSIAVGLVGFAAIAELSFKVNEAKSQPIERDDKNANKPDEVYDYAKDEAEEEKKERTVEEWYEIEKPVCEEMVSKEEDVIYHLDTEISKETMWVNEGQGYPNRVTALKMLLDEYKPAEEEQPEEEPVEEVCPEVEEEPVVEEEPIKTVQEWYEEEKAIIESLEYVQPLEYIDKETEVEEAKVNEGCGFENRVTALNMLHDEYNVIPEKTVEEWYAEEKEVCEGYVAQDIEPIGYIREQIVDEQTAIDDETRTGFPNRVTALKMLEVEYLTVEDWYAIEKPKCEIEISKGKDPVKYIDTQLRSENKKISNGEGRPNRSKALQILHDEYYVKTVEEWYHEEKIISEGLTETDPLDYFKKELASEEEKVNNNSGYPNRVEALKLLIEDLEEERAEQEIEAKRLSEEEEARIREQEILAARAAYVESKKKGEEVIVPVMAFLLSREDILDYVDHMVGKKYPVPATIRRRKKNYMSDGLKCGAWTFGLVYEKEEVVKLIAPMDGEYANKLMEEHTGVKASKFPKNGNWYSIIFDSSYASKEEVYEILDYLYNYVLNKYYTYDKKLKKWVTDESAAEAEINEIDEEAQTYDKEDDEDLDQAIAEHNQSLEQYREKYKVAFTTSREKIQKYCKRIHFDSELIIRDKAHKPTTLKLTSNNKAYVMLYEKDGKVWMIVRCYEKYAKMLQRYHPLTTRARFPRVHNWYVVHIDGTYKTSGAIYKVIKNAKKYAIDGTPKEIKAPKQRKKASAAKQRAKKATKKVKAKAE